MLNQCSHHQIYSRAIHWLLRTTEQSLAAIRTNMGHNISVGFKRFDRFRESVISRSITLSIFRRCLFHSNASSVKLFLNKLFVRSEVPLLSSPISTEIGSGEWTMIEMCIIFINITFESVSIVNWYSLSIFSKTDSVNPTIDNRWLIASYWEKRWSISMNDIHFILQWNNKNK